MLDDNFVIDNENIILKNKLQEYLPVTQQASIAVGYFFISGFAEIMDHLKKIENSTNPEHVIRLLISPVTNRLTAEAMIAGNEAYDEVKNKILIPQSEEDVNDKTINDVKKTLEHMPQEEKEQLAVKKLIDLISSKKLQVKVYTKEQLHAKAYIFDLDIKHLQRVAIVGSSNLSISGIKQHAELNIITTHPKDSQDVKDWFERHWNDESCTEFTDHIAEILEKSWAGKEYTPSDVYGKAAIYEHEDILDELLFDDIKYDIKDTIKLFDFQKKAVSDAIKKLESYGGVIIADVVGMGKTFIGSAILKYLREHDRSKPLVICPPHLIDMWKKYLDNFEISGEVVSRYQIGMEDYTLRKHTHCDVVLIDESHNFRNPNTNAYKALLAFMEEKTDDVKVILLSATPISNGIKDLKNQLRLFPSGGLEMIPPLGTTSLDEYFKGTEDKAGVTEAGAEKIKELLRYILIRRTRTQILKKYAKKDGIRWYLEQEEGRKYFPQRNLQNPEEYDADKVYNNAYESIENAIRDLKMSRYAPGKYIKEEYINDGKYRDLLATTKPLTGIVRTSLLKRMESSIKAFDASVKNYVKGYRVFREELNNGIVPIGKEFHDEIYKKIEDDDYDLEEKLSGIKSKYSIEAFDVELWKKEIDADLDKFAKIQGHLIGKDFEVRDDKLHKLRDLVKVHDEKILIFSESAVTTKYIYEYLEKEFPELKIAQIDSNQSFSTKNELVKKFDPKNNDSIIPKHEQLDVLVSTDVLSEGVNLHAGRIVINYDFHWNPVRLIQRVGRIDRIGSEHALIDIFNFLPTTKIDATLSLQEKVANKIKTIRKIVGHDQQILSDDEVIDVNSTSAIYNPDENDSDDVLDSSIGILDVGDTDSEKHADEIMKNKAELEYYQKLPFGIRGISGKGKLLIACEAEETIKDQDGAVISKQSFRQHYEVISDTAKPITASSFLKQIGNSSKKEFKGVDLDYNTFVSKAWKQFNRDMKNTMVKKKILKHQRYFDAELKRIGVNPELTDRVMELSPFVKGLMRGNYQPYRKLIDFHKMIDNDKDANDTMIIEGLEKIMKSKYGKIQYKKIICKPKILYSMMVET